jgi:hypothetical protein
MENFRGIQFNRRTFAMTQSETTNIERTDSAILRVDFNHPELCTDCNPVTCTVNGEPVSVGTWPGLLVNLVEMFIAKGNLKISDLFNKPLLPGSSRPFLLKEKSDGATRKITTGHWIYVNYNRSFFTRGLKFPITINNTTSYPLIFCKTPFFTSYPKACRIFV